MVAPKYKRILIKLSGEALAGEKGIGINISTVQKMAEEIKEVHDLGIEIALVIGGGNLWRGEPAAEAGMDRVQADYTGMLGTVMNALVMADSLQQVGVDTRVQTAIAMQQVAETLYSWTRSATLGKRTYRYLRCWSWFSLLLNRYNSCPSRG